MLLLLPGTPTATIDSSWRYVPTFLAALFVSGMPMSLKLLPPALWRVVFRRTVRRAPLLLVTLLTTLPVWAGTGLVPNGILIRYHSAPATLAQAAEALPRSPDWGALRAIGHRTYLMPLRSAPQTSHRGRSHAGMAEALARLRADPQVAYAEPNYLGQFADAPAPLATPNDPAFPSASWLDGVGARQAWAVSSGSGVVVAQIDSGTDLSHPDLQANLLPGYNFGDQNATPQDVVGHGTKVAGILAARRGNGLGASGLAPLAKILPVKINAGGLGTFDSATLAQAIDYAVAQGAKVLNLSLTVDSQTQTVGEAITRAQAAGAIVVASTGNQSGAVAFPASMPGVIAVAASNADGTLASYANRGPEVTLAAPGSGIFTTLLGGGYGSSGNGTSFSAPMVSATIANLLATEPRMNAALISSLLRASARPITGSTQPFGILDAGQSLLALLPDLQPTLASGQMRVGYRLPVTGGPVRIYVAVTTPFGEFALLPDGRWQAAAAGYPPLAIAYDNAAAASGNLFGPGGVFPAIAVAGLPSGSYLWRTALARNDRDAGIGPVITSPINLPP